MSGNFAKMVGNGLFRGHRFKRKFLIMHSDKLAFAQPMEHLPFMGSAFSAWNTPAPDLKISHGAFIGRSDQNLDVIKLKITINGISAVWT